MPHVATRLLLLLAAAPASHRAQAQQDGILHVVGEGKYTGVGGGHSAAGFTQGDVKSQ